ncbi:MAG: cache domain-containing protein, partial [Myxococcota bacterium]
LLVTATRALRDGAGTLLGVAAVDITVGYLIDTFLEPPGLAAPAEGWLVDGDGNVVVRSSLKHDARSVRTYAPPPFPSPEVLAAVRAGGAANHHEHEGVLYAWSTLPTLGWTYIVSGDAAALLGEAP